MQDIKGEAMAMYDKDKLEWCRNYTTQLRTIQLQKYDEVTAKIMEYLDKHIKLTPEEIEAEKNKGTKKQSKGDGSKKKRVDMGAMRQDIMFGLMINI